MNTLKTLLQRARRTCGWVMFKPSIRYLVLGLLLACVGAVRPEGAGNWADSRYFDVAHVRCPVALQVAAPQELRVRRLSGGTLTVSWQRLTPPFPGDALQAETEVLVVVDAGTAGRWARRCQVRSARTTPGCIRSLDSERPCHQ